MNVRLEGYRILYHVLEEGAYSHLELNQFMKMNPKEDPRDKAFVERLVRGTLERLYLIDTAIDSVSKTKVAKQKPPVRTILRLSVCQLLYMSAVPDSAVCNEAVKLAVHLKLGGLKGFVNGVLRNLSRNIAAGYTPDPGNGKDLKTLSLHYSMPLWMTEKLTDYLGTDCFIKMAEALSEPVKLSVFNNAVKQTPDLLKHILEDEGMKVSRLPWQMEGFYLDHVSHLERQTSFREGRFLIQDLSSMLEGAVASPKENQYIIDACAAPGGKTFHAAIAMKGTGIVNSNDIGQAKIKLLKENAQRLGLPNVRIFHRDALKYDPSLFEKADILIADLPCSGLGIMGRKPEIRYNLNQGDIEKLASLQKNMLHNLARYVKPGGRLIYSTCTVTKEENIQNFQYITEVLPFHAESLDAYLPDELKCKTTKDGYLQLIPGIHPCDGFFIASAVKDRSIHGTDFME